MEKPSILEFWVKMAKMTFNVKDNDPHFQYQPRVSQDACLVQISWFQPLQCSAKALEKWGQMAHTIEKYGDIGNFSVVIYVILPFVNLKFVGTCAPTGKIIGDIPDFNVLNVPKTRPRRNPAIVLNSLFRHVFTNSYLKLRYHLTWKHM